MKLCGLQKTTLLDYPGHLAATIFTGGCNFNCPYCHNRDLINPTEFISESKVLDFLEKRKSVLEGVCLTGGEPTLQKDLPDFLRKIRQMGYLIKLDSNGYQPDILKQLVEDKLIDYIAMDVKTSQEKYPLLAGLPRMAVNQIDESIRFLISRKVPHEFRTTVVREFHNFEDLKQICDWIKDCDSYYIQNYQDAPELPKGQFHPYQEQQLREFIRQMKPSIGNIYLRGL